MRMLSGKSRNKNMSGETNAQGESVTTSRGVCIINWLVHVLLMMLKNQETLAFNQYHLKNAPNNI